MKRKLTAIIAAASIGLSMIPTTGTFEFERVTGNFADSSRPFAVEQHMIGTTHIDFFFEHTEPPPSTAFPPGATATPMWMEATTHIDFAMIDSVRAAISERQSLLAEMLSMGYYDEETAVALRTEIEALLVQLAHLESRRYTVVEHEFEFGFEHTQPPLATAFPPGTTATPMWMEATTHIDITVERQLMIDSLRAALSERHALLAEILSMGYYDEEAATKLHTEIDALLVQLSHLESRGYTTFEFEYTQPPPPPSCSPDGRCLVLREQVRGCVTMLSCVNCAATSRTSSFCGDCEYCGSFEVEELPPTDRIPHFLPCSPGRCLDLREHMRGCVKILYCGTCGVVSDQSPSCGDCVDCGSFDVEELPPPHFIPPCPREQAALDKHCCGDCNRNVLESQGFIVIVVIMGDVRGFGNAMHIGVQDALQILRYAVGLENVLEQCDSAYAAARITGGEKPGVADALEILRHSVGLPSLLDNLG